MKIGRKRGEGTVVRTHCGRQLQLGSLPVALLKELAGHQLGHLRNRNVSFSAF